MKVGLREECGPSHITDWGFDLRVPVQIPASYTPVRGFWRVVRRKREPMHPDQNVSGMLDEPLVRQARVRA
jgi:hypothetical protein